MGAPQLSGPSWVDVPNSPQFHSGVSNSSKQLVRRGTALYLWQTFPLPATSSQHTAVYKSTDEGTTWNVLDGAHSPDGTGTPYYDAVNNQWIGALVLTPLVGARNPLFLQNFSFLTETWGTAYNTGGPLCLGQVDDFLLRPDGTFVVVFEIGQPNLLGHSSLKASVLPAALSSWGSQIDLGIAIVPFISNGNVLGSTSVVDSSGNMHTFFQDSNKTHFLYQQLLASNSLGPSFHWAAATLGNPTSIWGETLIFGGALYTPIVANSFNTNKYVVGTPLSSPVFTIQAPVNVQRSGISGGTGQITTDGSGTLFWCVNWAPSFQFTKYQIFTSTDGLTWTLFPNNTTSPYFYDFAVSPTPPNIDALDDQRISPFIIFPNVVGSISKGYLFVVTQNLSSGLSMTAFLNAILFGTPTPPAPAQSFALLLFGWKLFKKEPCDTSTQEVPECPPVDRAV